MFLHYRIQFIALIIFTVTGCINTANLEQQEKISNLESALTTAQALTQKTQNELSTTTKHLDLSKKKITTLSTALKNSKNKLESTIAAEESKVTHLANKTVIGQVEWVYVSKVKENFKGRIDTGAATSSINAVNIEHFERDGKKWVRFHLTHSEGTNADMIEAKVIRTAKIRQSGILDEKTERPVIELHVRIGDIAHLTEFTLTNRQQMAYPVLIGRTFLRDVILVDVSKEFNVPEYQIQTNPIQ